MVLLLPSPAGVVSSHCKHALASHVVADLDLGFEFIDSDEDEHIEHDFKAFEYKLAGCGVDFNFLSDFWPDTEEIGYEYYYVQFKKYGSELTTSACNYYFSVSLMHDIVTRLLIAHVPFRTSMTLREFEELMPFDAVIDIFEVPYSNDMQIREIGALWTSAGQLIDTGTITYKGDSLKPYCYSQKGYKEGVRTCFIELTG
ncbi:HAD hydrolase [Striga asiatica]|uniref:HAD hydrolase n=1 Tax=Striga asiatica TaxID=4170 RepID=A0A5A7R4Y9_STRAF|nr:HAD hydrolase [Striga asiatica]